MDDFCGSRFWDEQLTWNTSNPDFTQCFQNTALVWIPCGFLWIFAPLDIFLTSKKNDKHIPWTLLHVLKIILSVGLSALALLELSYSMTEYSKGELVYPSNYYTPFIKACSFIMVIFLVGFNRLKGVCTSGILFLFWLLMFIGEVVVYRSSLMRVFYDEIPYNSLPTDLSFIIISCSLPLVLGEFLLFCFADTKPRVVQADKSTARECPEETASFLSKLTFWWFNRMALLGFKKPLVMNDMWKLSEENTAKHVLRKFDKYWIPLSIKALGKNPDADITDAVSFVPKKDNEEENDDLKKARLSLLIPTIKAFWWEMLVSGFMKLVGCLMAFVSPVILNLLITFVTKDEPVWRGFFYAGVLFFSSMVESIFNSQHEYWIFRLAMRVRATVTSTLYKKALILSSSARRKYTVAEIVNLMSVDSQRVVDYVQLLHYAWASILQVSLALYMLYQQLGVSMFAGLGFMILLFPFNGYLTIKIKNLQVEVMKEKDKRTRLMNEILNGIKVLKLYAWEESFEERVSETRRLEIRGLRKQAYYSAVTTFSFTSATFMIALTSFTTYIFIDPNNVLDANTAFVSFSLFNIIRVPFASLPILVSYTATFIVALKRLNSFLSCDELDPDSISYDKSEENPVVIEDGTFTWERDGEPLLKNIDLGFKPGSLTAIVGSVGSGKSSLLSALLGDMDKVSGRVNINGSLAYVPQQAWIQNDTLRKNILFTKQFEEKYYKKVLETCCLNPDLEMLPGGDLTEIGEKGINLSGGQKQRVSLARAVYSDADIYLLDDPLSAVDAHVSKDLFDKVIGPKGVLQRKTRILVSHRINVLPEVDTIIVLKNGDISEMGSYEELLQQKGAFAEFLVHHISEQSVSEGVSENDLQLIEEIANKVGSSELLRQVSHLSASSDGTLSDTDKEGNLRSRFSRQFSTTSGSDGLRRRSSISLAPKRFVSQAELDAQMTTKKSKLTEAEFAETGSVKMSVYVDYSKACGLMATFILILSFAACYGFNIGTNIWLSEWSNDALVPEKAHNTALRDLRLGVYGALGAGETICMLVASIILSIVTLKGARLIHDKSLSHILQAPMSFFDTTPLGRIINRFTKDIDSMDNTIRFSLLMLFICVFGGLACFIVIALQSAYLLLVFLPLSFVYYIVQKLYIATSRQLKRLESVSRSPMYTHFSETVSGSTSIRAYGASKVFIEEFLKRVDTNNSAFFPSLPASRWLAIRLEFLGYIISFIAALFAVLNRDSLSPGLAGLSISYALRVTIVLNMLVRSTADVETNIVSVERCLEYTTTPTEAPRKRDNHKPPANWPSEGRIQFNGYSTRYREGLELVLTDVSCDINPSEKIGIVGRTGAGKSSFTLSLFRLIEAASGNILIDGIDIANLGLYDLRSKLTIIPQDPVLFTGTLRMNLDPFSTHTDEEVWRALEQSHLKSYVTTLDKGLNHLVIEGGENLSVGQRQLLCLGRALLRKTKVLIMDEATAAVDMETDELIQQTIRSEFKDCTVLTIAHRLNTVMDYDRIIVLDKGRMSEFDSPSNLLQNESTIFHSMAKDANLV